VRSAAVSLFVRALFSVSRPSRLRQYFWTSERACNSEEKENHVREQEKPSHNSL
jgi:hypothetical protein